MTYAQKVAAARKFVQRWQGRGQEKSDTHTFWLDLCDSVIGMEHVATTVLFESQTNDRGWIDAVIPDAKTFIEQKSIGVDLDRAEMRQGIAVTPFEQAKRYADSQRNSQRPDTIIVSNFEMFRIHDLDQENRQKTTLSSRSTSCPISFICWTSLSTPKSRERGVRTASR